MNYSDAIAALMDGKTIARSGWNNTQGMWTDSGKWIEPSKTGDGTFYARLKTPSNNYIPWGASAEDMSSDDWVILAMGAASAIGFGTA